jgi:hypothetical protein
MKFKKLYLISLTGAFLLNPATVLASSYDEAVKDAKASINNAKSLNYEWRDSRKLLEQANKLNKEGKTDEALRLVAEAKKQGEMAVVQAKLQADVNGPH